MLFQLTEEQLMIQRAARDFAQQECKAGVIERDEKQKFPHEQVMKLAELGFLGMMVKPEYGDELYILIIPCFAYCKIKAQIPAGKRDYISCSFDLTKSTLTAIKKLFIKEYSRFV